MKGRRDEIIIVLMGLAAVLLVLFTDCSDQGVEPEEDVPQDSLVTMADKKAIE